MASYEAAIASCEPKLVRLYSICVSIILQKQGLLKDDCL